MDRNIFYQNVDLFKSQGVVDDLVDNLAFTLGLGREDLNIVCSHSADGRAFPILADDYKVAAAKGLISGPVDLILRGGDVVHCSLPPDGVSAFTSGKLGVDPGLDYILSRSCSPTFLQSRKWTFMRQSGCWLLRKRSTVPLHRLRQLLMKPRPLLELLRHRNMQATVLLDPAS